MTFTKIFSIAALSISAAAFSQGIQFSDGSWKSQLDKAKAQDKLIFVDAYASWCGPCKMMDKNVFTTKEVGDYYNSHFINVKLDMEKGEGVDFAKKYGIRSYPSFVFINKDGEKVHSALGYMTPKDFIAEGEKASNPAMSQENVMKVFNSGSKDPQILLQVFKNHMYTQPEIAMQAAERYMAQKTTPSYSSDDIMVLMTSIRNDNDPFFARYLKDKKQIAEVVPPARLEEFEKAIKARGLFEATVDKTNGNIDEAKFMSMANGKFTPQEAKAMLNEYKMQMAIAKNDMTQFMVLAKEVYADPSQHSSEKLNSAAWTAFEHIQNPIDLQTALQWALESVRKSENYANTDTVANLYNKLGDKMNARIWAEKSVQLAKINGEDAESTQKLLDSLK